MGDFSWKDTAVQFAIGITAAVLGGYMALYGVDKQMRREELSATVRKQEDEMGLLCTLYAELDVAWTHYWQPYGHNTEWISREKGGVGNQFPIGPTLFPVYQQNAASLGIIKDRDLRRQIIKSYAAFDALMSSVAINNDIILQIRDREDSKNPEVESQCKAYREKLRSHGHFLGKAQAKAKTEIELTLKLLTERGCGV